MNKKKAGRGPPVKCYEIRLRDQTLLTFGMETSSLGIPSIRDVRVRASDGRLLPPTLWNPTPDGVLDWLATRVVPKNRAFVDKICESVGVSPGDTFGIIDVCLGLSVDDAYWVVPDGFPGTWQEYNLYDHDLDAALALVAYTGHSAAGRRRAGLSTEWTTSGNYPKAWRRIGGKLVLYKAGSPLNEGTANPDYGSYSEFFAAQVANQLGIEHTPYDLDVWEGRLASTCPHPLDARRLGAMESLLHANGRWVLDMEPRTTADVKRWIASDFAWDGGTSLVRAFIADWDTGSAA